MLKAAGYDWNIVCDQMMIRLEEVSDPSVQERYALDCANLLAERIADTDGAIALLIRIGSRRPSLPLAVRLAELFEAKGDIESAYDWLLEALELSDSQELQRIRVKCAELAVDQLSLRVEGTGYLRDYVSDGGRDAAVLSRLLTLIPTDDSQGRLDVMGYLIEASESDATRRAVRAQFIILAEAVELCIDEALDHVFASDFDGEMPKDVLFSGYRLARRTDRIDEFNQVMRRRGATMPNGLSLEQTNDDEFLNDYPASEAEVALQKLVKIGVNDALGEWIKEHRTLFGARLVPLVEMRGDLNQIERFDCAELALELSIDDVDQEVVPTSCYGLLSDMLCARQSTGSLRVKAEQMGGRFPKLKQVAFGLAGYEAIVSGENSRAKECFELADKIMPLGRAEARASRYIAWQLGDQEQVRASIERELSGVPEQAQRDLLIELALVDEKGGNLERAEAYYQRVVQNYANWLPASYGLGTLLDRQGRWRELAYMVDEELQGDTETGRVDLALVGRLAEIYEHHLDQLDEAALLYERVRRHKPSAPDAILGLSRIYERQGRWADLVSLLESLVDVYVEPRSRAFALFRAGEVEEFKRGDAASAMNRYAEALKHDANALIVWALESAALKTQDRSELFQLYNGPHAAMLSQLDVRKALTLAPIEAIGSVENLASDSGGIVWAILNMQLACELQRGDLIGSAMSGLAAALPTSEEREGLFLQSMYELSDRDGELGLWELLTKVQPDGVAALYAWQLVYASYNDAAPSPTMLELVEWLIDVPLPAAELGALRSLKFMMSAELNGVEKALEGLRWAETPNGERVPWMDHLVTLPIVEGAVPAGQRAAAMLRLASLYAGGSEGSVKAFTSGRLFERSDSLNQAVEAYRWAVQEDPSMLAAMERLVALIGVAITQNNAVKVLLDAADRADSEAHRVTILRMCLSVLERFDGDVSMEFDLLARLAEVDALDGFHRRYGELLLSHGRRIEAVVCLDSLLSASDDLEEIVWASYNLGLIFLANEQYHEAIDRLRQCVAISGDAFGLSGLSLAYLKSGQYELARLSYERLETASGSEEGSDIEARLGRMVSLQKMGRLEAALNLAEFGEKIIVNARARLLITQLDERLKEALPFKLNRLAAELTPQPLFRSDSGSNEDKMPSWLFTEEPSSSESNKIETAWHLQRKGWLSGTLVSTPLLARKNNALQRSLVERLLPEEIHPSLVDSVKSFACYNDPFFTDTSGPLAPLSEDELERLKQVAETLNVEAFEVRLDTINHFRVDCRAGPNPCVILGHDLFESLTLDQMEFLFAWCFAVVRLGAMPPTFMRAARRFGTKEFVAVLKWLEATALGHEASVSSAKVDWGGEDEVRSQMMEVLEWTSASQKIDPHAIYAGLQSYGLRLAMCLSPSYGVAMETIRLIEMDDRSLGNLSVADLRSVLDRDALLKQLDSFSQSAECLQARSVLFDGELR